MKNIFQISITVISIFVALYFYDLNESRSKKDAIAKAEREQKEADENELKLKHVDFMVCRGNYKVIENNRCVWCQITSKQTAVDCFKMVSSNEAQL